MSKKLVVGLPVIVKEFGMMEGILSEFSPLVIIQNNLMRPKKWVKVLLSNGKYWSGDRKSVSPKNFPLKGVWS